MLPLYMHTHFLPISPAPELLATTNQLSMAIILSLDECYIGQLDIHTQNNEPEPYLTPYKNISKINSK